MNRQNNNTEHERNVNCRRLLIESVETDMSWMKIENSPDQSIGVLESPVQDGRSPVIHHTANDTSLCTTQMSYNTVLSPINSKMFFGMRNTVAVWSDVVLTRASECDWAVRCRRLLYIRRYVASPPARRSSYMQKYRWNSEPNFLCHCLLPTQWERWSPAAVTVDHILRNWQLLISRIYSTHIWKL